MSQLLPEIQCVTAIYNEDLLCVQDDDGSQLVAVARDEKHMAELLEAINQISPIDKNAIVLSIFPESEVLNFLRTTPKVHGLVFFTNGNLLAVNEKRVLESGFAPFLYYNTDIEPIYYPIPEVLETKNQFYLAVRNDVAFTVYFEGFRNLLLVTRTEEQMSDLASMVNGEAPFNFDNVDDLMCELVSEERILGILQEGNVDGMLFISDSDQVSYSLRDYILEMGVQACIST